MARRVETYGIYGTHTPETCPLFHEGNRKLLLEAADGFEAMAARHDVKLVSAWHSGLEHTFVWIVEAENAHSIQDVMVESGMAKFNSTKIVPMSTLESVVERCRRL